MDDPSTSGTTVGFGLMFYNARWYDPTLGRFAQADTVIPPQQGVQAWDRYAYVNNNPLLYTDPSGHNCVLGALLGWMNISFSCPTTTGSGPYINIRVKEKGVDIGGIDLPLPPDATPGWIDPKVGPSGPEADINVPLPGDDWQEGFDSAPDDDSLGILAETEEDDTDETEDDDKRFDEDQDALIQLAKDAKNKGGVTEDEAEILFDWANEYGLDSHGNAIETHPNRNFNIPHIHIGPVDHIPVAI